jgi:hypothetical protein
MLSQWLSWIPKFVIRRAAHSYGIVDPAEVLAKVRSFSQPSEVKEPIELLRAGILFQARGLINTRAIQFNLDWIWPYWVEKQFNPDDPSFIPRAYSATHVNITHRNWAAAALPNYPVYPLVDPRGLVSPLYEGWSIDFWVVSKDGKRLAPSQLPEVEQIQEMGDRHIIRTKSTAHDLTLNTAVELEEHRGSPSLRVDITATAHPGAKLVASVRPYNTEGVAFIESIQYDKNMPGFLVDEETKVVFDKTPEKAVFARYEEGDVCHSLDAPQTSTEVKCDIGMSTAAAVFPFEGDELKLSVFVPLEDDLKKNYEGFTPRAETWADVMSGTARMSIPDERIQYLYDAAARTVVLLSAHEVVPGPFTYRRFWFRDAVLMINAMLCLGLEERSRQQIDMFFPRQRPSGYYRSQEGEWDSNGQVLWLLERWYDFTGKKPAQHWLDSMAKGADWIRKKRITNEPGKPHNGLYPAGFSAEHLGPNDYYYWDDFWGVAGLKSAARLAGLFIDDNKRLEYHEEACEFENTTWKTIEAIPHERSQGGIPASPYRRMDAGAIGSMVCDYPLLLNEPGDKRIMNTLEFLMDRCFHRGGFFQDMVHSGVNAYLTFACAQTLLRVHDDRYVKITKDLAGMASQAGHWPEAVHPFSGGGCMGDGQHGWAAAEWTLLIRNLFVREEGKTLVLGSGVFPEWLQEGREIFFGPTPTPHGPVTLRLTKNGDTLDAVIEAELRGDCPEMLLAVPGYGRKTVKEIGKVVLERV